MSNDFSKLNEFFCPSCLFRCHHIIDFNKHLMEKHLVQIPLQLIGFNQNRNFNNSQHKSLSNFQSIEKQKLFSEFQKVYLSKLVDNKFQPHQAFCNSVQPLVSSAAFSSTNSKNVSRTPLTEYLNTLLVLQGSYDNHLVNGTNHINPTLKPSSVIDQNSYVKNSLQQKSFQQYPLTLARREKEVSCSEIVQDKSRTQTRSVDFATSPKQQDLNDHNPAKVRTSPTDNVKRNQAAHKRSLELHILKLISDNEKVLTNPNFEKVKPRRVLRQGSLDSNYLTNDSIASSQHNSIESFKNSYSSQPLTYQTPENLSNTRKKQSNPGTNSDGRRTIEALKPIKFHQCLECGVRYRKEANYNAHKQFYCQYRKKPFKPDSKRLNDPQKQVNAVQFADRDQARLKMISNQLIHNHLAVYSGPKYSESHFQASRQARDLENNSLSAKSYFLKHVISLNGKREIAQNTRLLDGLDLSLSSNVPRNNYKVLLHRLNLQNMQDMELRKKSHQEKLATKRSLHHNSYIPSKYCKMKSSLPNKSEISSNYFYEKSKFGKVSSKDYKLEDSVPSADNSLTYSSKILVSNPTKCASNIRIKSSINQLRCNSSTTSSNSLKLEDLLNGHLQPSLNPKLQTSFCSLNNPQPYHVEMKNENQLSMYSQWQTVKPFLPDDLHVTELLSSWRCSKKTLKSHFKSRSFYQTAGCRLKHKYTDLIVTDSKSYRCKRLEDLKSNDVSVSRCSTDSGIMLTPRFPDIQPKTSKQIHSIKSINPMTLSGDDSSSKCEVSLPDSNQNSSSSTGFLKNSRVKKLKTRRERTSTSIYFKNSRLKHDCGCNCKHLKKSKERIKKSVDGILLSNNVIKTNKGANSNEEKPQSFISTTTSNSRKDVITTTNSRVQVSHNRIFSTKKMEQQKTTFDGSKLIDDKKINMDSNFHLYKCVDCKLSFRIIDHLSTHLHSKSHANTIQKMMLKRSRISERSEVLDERLSLLCADVPNSIVEVEEPQNQEEEDENLQRQHKNKKTNDVDDEGPLRDTSQKGIQL